MSGLGHCSIANGGCKAPAGRQVGSAGGPRCDEPVARVARCGFCGDDVCTGPACSSLVCVKKGDVRPLRACANCADEEVRPGSEWVKIELLAGTRK